MTLPDFPYLINFSPARKGVEASMLIEARIGTRTVRRSVKCSSFSAMEEEAWLGSHVQYLLGKVRDSEEYREAHAVSAELAGAG